MASTATDWSKLTVVNLRAELKQRDLSTAGRKEELVQRLVDFAGDAAADAAGAPGAEEGSEGAAEAAKGDDAEMADGPAADDGEPAPAPATEALAAAVEAASADQPSAAQPPVSMPPPPSTVPMAEVAADEQKRKRRSVTPPPSTVHGDAMDDSSSSSNNKRPRIEDQDAPAAAPATTTAELAPPQDTEMAVDEGAPTPAADEDMRDAAGGSMDDDGGDADDADDADYVRDAASVAPAIHPATAALYICHLMRPLRPSMLEDYVVSLAAPPSRAGDADAVVTTAFLDPIKTHAFVVFSSIAAAARVRAALHGRVWPDESNRRPLWVDFVPSASVPAWIDQERAAGGGRHHGGSRSSAKKWEVVYSEADDGQVATTLREAGSGGARGASVPGRILYDPSNDTGAPRAAADAGDLPARRSRSPPPLAAPRGPRGDALPPPPPPPPPSAAPPARERRRGRGDGPWAPLDSEVRVTRTSPALNYQVVTTDLANRRLDSIWFYTQPRPGSRRRSASPGPGRDGQSYYTKTHNRYTFEQGDQLVDRGPEMFDGIRPPHREREKRLQRSGRGGGGAGGRRRRRGNGGGGRVYDDYRPARDNPSNWDRADRGGDGRKNWGDRRDRGRNDRGGMRDEREREGRLDSDRW